jgi:hypothetical protein
MHQDSRCRGPLQAIFSLSSWREGSCATLLLVAEGIDGCQHRQLRDVFCLLRLDPLKTQTILSSFS